MAVPRVVATWSEQERGRIRTHLGYPDAEGTPALIGGSRGFNQTSYLVDRAIDALNETGKPFVMQCVAQCDRLEAEMMDMAGVVVASQLGTMRIDDKGFEKLIGQYDVWVAKLGAALGGIGRNPADPRKGGGGGSSRNGHRRVG